MSISALNRVSIGAAYSPSSGQASGQAPGTLKLSPAEEAAEESRALSAKEKFHETILERAKALKKTQAATDKERQDADGAAKGLADSLSRAMDEIKTAYGQETADEAMGRILNNVDAGGLSLESITSAMSKTMDSLAAKNQTIKFQNLVSGFNADLSQSLPGDKSGGDGTGKGGDKSGVKSLSHALGQFWGLESARTEEATLAKGFSEKGAWADQVIGDAQGEPAYKQGDFVGALKGLEKADDFAFNILDEGVVSGLANFLRFDLGNSEAADYLEMQGSSAGFMAAVDTVVTMVAAEGEAGQITALEGYLNGTVAKAVNDTASLKANGYGTLKFEGWRFGEEGNIYALDDPKDPASGKTSKGVTEFSRAWSYGNREDVAIKKSNKMQDNLNFLQSVMEESGQSLRNFKKSIVLAETRLNLKDTSSQLGQLLDKVV